MAARRESYSYAYRSTLLTAKQSDVLVPLDRKALTHIFSANCYDYTKSKSLAAEVRAIVGDGGIVTSEGEPGQTLRRLGVADTRTDRRVAQEASSYFGACFLCYVAAHQYTNAVRLRLPSERLVAAHPRHCD